MADLKKKQIETNATIDMSKAISDSILGIMGIMTDTPALSVNISNKPLPYLIQLLERVGVSYEDLKLWLTDFLIYVVPALEIGVKAILLTNLKNMISCSIDPRIPEQYRKRHKSSGDRNTPNEYGIDIDIESIDFLGKLNHNPLTDCGRDLYFGLDGITDVYKFARAEDFDAFLWFVIHKGKFPMSAKVNSINNTFRDDIHGSGDYSVEPENGSLLDVLSLTSPTNKASRILPGNTFTYDSISPGVVSMCIEAIRDEKDNIVKNTLVPVSDDLTSVNWYIRRRDAFTYNIFGNNWSAETIKGKSPYLHDQLRTIGSVMKNKPRDFSKEKGICNLQYIDQGSSDSPINGLVNNKLRFTILPKPLMHIPNIDAGEPPWRFKKMLFDAKGNYDPNGKYTIANVADDINLEYLGGLVSIEPKSGAVTVTDNNEVVKHLIECYPGLTVYEFNYDYVMGMKLFDAKVLASTLLRSLVNTQVGINISGGIRHYEGSERIRTIIRSIVDANDERISDCFYTFDNRKYDELLRRTEEKKAGRSSLTSVMEILEEYDDAPELHQRKEILSRAIEQAAVSVSEGADERDVFEIKYSFITDLIENLIMSIMEAVLSPKVLMLLEVNERLMGGTWKKFSLEDVLKAMESVIMSLAREIRDLLIQEILKLLMNQLQPLVELTESAIVRERLENFAETLENIITNCPRMWFNFGNQDLETRLDTVDYADIDTSSIRASEQPIINNC